MDQLILKRTWRSSGKWADDDYDVLADGVVVGRIFKGRRRLKRPWLWTLAYAITRIVCRRTATREAAMAAFAKSWRRE